MMTEVQKPMTDQERDNESSNKKHRGSIRIAVSSAIVWLESLRVPQVLQRSGGDTSPDGTPMISGLERVFFGTQPACDAVLICGIHPPRYLCYMLSGFICDLIQFTIDIILHRALLLDDASVCWALGFGISVAFRHTSHRYLVFGDYVGGYWKSLGRMYAGYSIIIVISTLFNIIMTRYLQLPHYVAWIVTLLWTGIVNYFILKKLWSFGGKDKKDDAPERNESKKDVESSSNVHDPEQRSDGRLQARKVDHKR